MWYDAWLYGCTQNMLWMAAVSSCTSHVRTKQHCNYTTWVNIQSALQPKPLCACHLNHGTLTDAETVTLQPKPLCAHHLNHGTLTDVETVTLQPKPLCACHLNHGTLTDVETVTLQPKPLCACHLNHGTLTDVETVTLQPKPPKGVSGTEQEYSLSKANWLIECGHHIWMDNCYVLGLAHAQSKLCMDSAKILWMGL